MRNNRKGFTLIELLIVVVIVGILALAAIPLITSNTRDARRAEGEQLLGSARDAIRVESSKTGASPATISSFETLTQFAGEYFSVGDTITNTGSGATESGSIDATSNSGSATDGTGTMDFLYSSGNSDLTWVP